MLFQQDNGRCHKSMVKLAKLLELEFEPFPRSPYALDLVARDYYLIANLKMILRGKNVCSNDEVVEEAEAHLKLLIIL